MTKKVIPGNNSLQVDDYGRVLYLNPHGTFYSLATQPIANTANVQAIALEKHSDVHGLTHDLVTNNSRIYIESSGSYGIFVSGIADLAAAPGNKHIEVWYAIDGSAVIDSNTRVEIVSDNVEMTVAVDLITNINAGSYLEIMTWGDSTNCQWLATAAAAGPTRPASPSIIVSIKKISSYV